MNLFKRMFFCAAFFAVSLAPTLACAALEIEISGGGSSQIPIAIVPFGGAANTKENINEIIAADLARSGLFKVLETRGMANLPINSTQIKYANGSLCKHKL